MNPELRAYVAASRARQGLPPTVQDPATLERVAALMRLVDAGEPVLRKRRRKTKGGNA
jgi:hypothetical protein